MHLENELLLGCYSGPFFHIQLSSIFGNYHTAPLGMVFDSSLGKAWVINDHSFPCNNPSIPSTNSAINSSLLQCNWGCWMDCFLTVLNTPCEAEVAVCPLPDANCTC